MTARKSAPKRAKPDALAMLLEHCDEMAEWRKDEAPETKRAKTRRLLRALRQHDRLCAANRAYQHGYDVETFDVQTCERIRAAVLSRPARKGGRP